MKGLLDIVRSAIDEDLLSQGAITVTLVSETSVCFRTTGALFYFYNTAGPSAKIRHEKGGQTTFVIDGRTGKLGDQTVAIKHVESAAKTRETAAGPNWLRMVNPDYTACSEMIIELDVPKLCTQEGLCELAAFLRAAFRGTGDWVEVSYYSAA